ncbi:MAG: ACP phosphodiesterase [Bacteroidia bacterium]|nr:ACP phosphodiesterase [Bacteroidia bacterium]
MNYLAHSYLSYQKPDLIIGNFIADSIRGNQFEGLTDGIIEGIRLHRKIDTFTDSHPIYLTSKHRFSKDFDKYSGVLMDIIYDHYLAKNFEQYSALSLQTHANEVYNILKNNHDYLPENAKRFYGYMTERNILFHYSTLNGIETVLTHLSGRIRNRFELQLAIPILEANYQEIEEEFFVFFDDLQAFCKEQPELNG